MFHRRATKLAVDVLLLLALEPRGACCPVRELAARLGVPATYLAKIVQDLTRRGLLLGVRGPGGGLRLARPAGETSLWEILSAVEPAAELENCFLQVGRCDAEHPCPLHEHWQLIRSQIEGMLRSTTLGEIALKAHSSGALGMKQTGNRAGSTLQSSCKEGGVERVLGSDS